VVLEYLEALGVRLAAAVEVVVQLQLPSARSVRRWSTALLV
jgi:hypothetical protein